MINPKELRIGNLIYYSGGLILFERDIKQVQSIVRNTDELSHLIGFDDIRLEKLSYFHAIPLTPENLKKCGVQDEYRIAYHEKLSVTESGYIVYSNRRILTNLEFCKHIHQLQNLYFALTGEELPVNIQNNE